MSFTFRKLTDCPAREPVPPIRQPEPVKPSIAMGSHHRILLLTDSILESTPEHLFNRVQGHKCIRKTNYKLADIFNFEPEFVYSKFVIIACGVNDLARYGQTAHTLADLVTRRLTDCCDRHEDVTFIFSSVLYTKQDWLNHEIAEFNNIMFELSVTVPNLRFLDTHQSILNDRKAGKIDKVIMPQDSNGQHLTLAAKKACSIQLVNAVTFLVGRRQGLTDKRSSNKDWSWPLRELYVRLFRRIAASYIRSGVR